MRRETAVCDVVVVVVVAVVGDVATILFLLHAGNQEVRAS